MESENPTRNSTTESFMVPAEPEPFPSFTANGEDEEESFVILSKGSFSDLHNENNQPIQNNAVDDAQNLLKMEIASLNTEIIINGNSSTTHTKDDDNLVSASPLEHIQSHEECLKKLDEVLKENTDLKETIVQNNLSMKTHYDRIIKWKQDVQVTYEDNKNRFNEARSYIVKLKIDNHHLKDEVNEYRKIKQLQAEEIVSLKSRLNKINGSDLLASSQTDSFEINMKLESSNQKIGELEKQISEFHLRDKEYTDKERMLQEAVLDVQNQITYKNNEIKELKKQAQSKQADIDEANNQEVLTLRQQLMNSQIAITDLETELSKIKNLLEEKQEELDSNKNITEKMRSHTFALEAQLDVYKSDFEAERNAKESIKSQKEQLAEDIKNLQRRNQQLQDEVEMLRESNDFVVCSPNRRSLNNDNNKTTTPATTANYNSNSPPLGNYICPLCNKKFRSLMLVESHIEHCINTSD